MPGCHGPGRAALPILVDCTDSALDPGNPGVVRTTRLLGRALERDERLLPVFMLWDRSLRHYRLLRPQERERLASYGGPRGGGLDDADLAAALDRLRPPVLFLSEAPVDGQLGERLLWAYARSLLVAAMVYDLIPLSHPVLCVPEIVRRFPDYVEGIAGADALFPISAESLRQLERYAADQQLRLPARRSVAWLPAQLASWPRNAEPAPVGLPIRCLCVGSIEPRKNQASLIAAFESLVRRRPGLGLELTLVGGRFAGAEALAARIEALTGELPALRWTGIVDDETLAGLYRQSSFTVYPSLVEGFGLPIMESLWMGRPCLCHAGGVMAELAAGGGCMTTDMNDAAAIETALERLATDPALRDRLTREAQARELGEWSAYGAEIARSLLQLAGAHAG